MTNTQNADTQAPPKSLPVVSSLDALQKLCAEPVPVEFDFRGKHVTINARRLSPFETNILKLRREEVRPKLIRAKAKGEEDTYDIEDVEFRKRDATVQSEIRALAVFWGVPELQAMAPQLAAQMYLPSARAGIVEFVNGSPSKPGVLTEELTELIYQEMQVAEVSISGLINFTLPSGASVPQS